MKTPYILLLCVVALLPQELFAQQKSIPLNRYYTQEIDRSLLRDTVQVVHTGCKPLLESKIDLSKVAGYAKDSLKVYEVYEDKVLRSHLFQLKVKEKILDENLIFKSEEEISIAVDPIFDFSLGYDLADTSQYADTTNLINNTRGVQVLGDLGKQFSFLTGFYENQTFAPLYLKAFVDSTGVFPGFGRVKDFPAAGGAGFDYAMAYGNISYTPSDFLNLQFGHGKNFIGHGYRSLLLSDAAFNYPYLKATLYLFESKWQYTTCYATLQTLERLPLGEVPESLFKRKGYSYHYLSWIPHARLELGLFESIVWKRYDEKSGTLPQPFGGYLPVPGIHTALNSFAGENNVLVGANLKFKLNKHGYVYGQAALDDPAVGAIGYQAGIKYFDLLFKYFDIQLEWNNVGDNLYASKYALQSHSHTNQPLGHPAGPATRELIGIANYRWRRLIMQLKYNQLGHTLSPEGDWQNNPAIKQAIYNPWPERWIQQWDISAGVYLNPKTNMQLLIGWTDRIERIDYNWQSDFKQHASFLYIALRTNLINRYADF